MVDRLEYVIVITILAIFANYRLARIVVSDEIGHGIRAWVGRKAAGKTAYSPWWMLAGIVTCPDCAGVWMAFPLAFLAGPQSVGEFILLWLAIAGGQVFMECKS